MLTRITVSTPNKACYCGHGQPVNVTNSEVCSKVAFGRIIVNIILLFWAQCACYRIFCYMFSYYLLQSLLNRVAASVCCALLTPAVWICLDMLACCAAGVNTVSVKRMSEFESIGKICSKTKCVQHCTSKIDGD